MAASRSAASARKPAAPRARRSQGAARKAAAPRAGRAAPAEAPRRFGPVAIAFGAAAVVAGGLLVALSRAGAAIPGLGRTAPGDGSFGEGEHAPVDLMGSAHPGPEDRAAEAFRPDPTAPVPAGEREALRPATGPAPTLGRGETASR